MSNINEIINEIKTLLANDTDIHDFCSVSYAKDVSIKTGEFSVSDIPIQDIPIIIISDSFTEQEKRRFLFNETEANLLITWGILQNDIDKAEDELISLKNLIKLALKKDPLLNGKAFYCTVSQYIP